MNQSFLCPPSVLRVSRFSFSLPFSPVCTPSPHGLLSVSLPSVSSIFRPPSSPFLSHLRPPHPSLTLSLFHCWVKGQTVTGILITSLSSAQTLPPHLTVAMRSHHFCFASAATTCLLFLCLGVFTSPFLANLSKMVKTVTETCKKKLFLRAVQNLIILKIYKKK